MAPTLPTSCGSLPPEGAVLAWGGPALRTVAPTISSSQIALRHRRVPPEAVHFSSGRPFGKTVAPAPIIPPTTLRYRRVPSGAGVGVDQ